MQYEDPVSLTALYRPISIKDSDPKHTFSAPIIDEFTKTAKVNPLNDIALGPEWRIEDYEVDAKISEAEACIPLTNGGKFRHECFPRSQSQQFSALFLANPLDS